MKCLSSSDTSSLRWRVYFDYITSDRILRGGCAHLISSAMTRANKLFAHGVFDVLSVLLLQPATVTDSPLNYPGIFLLALLAQEHKTAFVSPEQIPERCPLVLAVGSRSITWARGLITVFSHAQTCDVFSRTNRSPLQWGGGLQSTLVCSAVTPVKTLMCQTWLHSASLSHLFWSLYSS